jgi:ABC-type oligopeptide transport system substrate-binding subunit
MKQRSARAMVVTTSCISALTFTSVISYSLVTVTADAAYNTSHNPLYSNNYEANQIEQSVIPALDTQYPLTAVPGDSAIWCTSSKNGKYTEHIDQETGTSNGKQVASHVFGTQAACFMQAAADQWASSAVNQQ